MPSIHRSSMLAGLAALALALPAIAAEAPKPSAIEHAPVLHVEVHGKGRPMLLIPGLSSSGEVWAGAVEHYRTRFEGHVVTLGGFAGKPRFEGPFLSTARDSLLAYVRTRGLKQPVVIGHSLGGVLALEMGISSPDAFGPLVIVDALPFLGGAGRPGITADSARVAMAPLRQMMRAQTREQYAAYMRNAPFLRAMVTRPDDLARVTEWGVQSDPVAVADAMFDVNTTDLRAEVARIKAPVLVLGSWYGMKEYTTREGVENTFRTQFEKLPKVTLAVADSAKHFIMLDEPAWTWKQIDAFLAGQVATQQGGSGPTTSPPARSNLRRAGSTSRGSG